MTTLTQPYRHNTTRVALIRTTDTLVEKLMPRRCMVVPTILILAGLSIPVLISIELISFSILLGFAGFALVATGGVLTLIFCGEI